MRQVHGVNLGSGDWTCPGWLSLDEVLGDQIDEHTQINAADSSLSSAYSAHFLEHVSNEVARHVMTEIHRVLAPGGFFRILVPDFEKLHEKYLGGDDAFFRELGFRGRPEWKQFSVEPTLENVLLHFFANYDHASDRGFYRGPPRVTHDEAVRKIRSLSTPKLSEWITGLVPIGAPGVRAQHINFWNYPKLRGELLAVGFSWVLPSRHLHSNIPEVAATGLFDSQKNRSLFTLYIEARK